MRTASPRAVAAGIERLTPTPGGGRSEPRRRRARARRRRRRPRPKPRRLPPTRLATTQESPPPKGTTRLSASPASTEMDSAPRRERTGERGGAYLWGRGNGGRGSLRPLWTWVATVTSDAHCSSRQHSYWWRSAPSRSATSGQRTQSKTPVVPLRRGATARARSVASERDALPASAMGRPLSPPLIRSRATMNAPSSAPPGDPDPTDEIAPSDSVDCPSTGPLPVERREACGF